MAAASEDLVSTFSTISGVVVVHQGAGYLCRSSADVLLVPLDLTQLSFTVFPSSNVQGAS